MTRKTTRVYAVLTIFAAALVMSASADGHRLKGQWWEGLTMQERLEGQLHLKAHAQKTVQTFKGSQLIKFEPSAPEALRRATKLLRVLRREIPETRAAISAAANSAPAYLDSESISQIAGAVYDASTGQWTIPAYIVMCESGGDYNAVNPSSGAYGAYQILPQHWSATGFGYGSPGICYGLGMDPAGQDECARRIWNSAGPGAWACA
jgi:hypothetical protein